MPGHRWLPLFGLLAVLLAASVYVLQGQTPEPSPDANATASAAPNSSSAHALDLRHARGFSVEERDGYRYVRVHAGGPRSKTDYTYALIDHQAPVPALPAGTQVIRVPVRKFAAMETTYLADLEYLDAADTLVGIGEFYYVCGDLFRRRIDSGKIREIGRNSGMDLEVLLDMAPDLVMTSAAASTVECDFNKVMAAGIPVVVNLEYLEAMPLGRAEWIKFTSLFLGREAEAERRFSHVEQAYAEAMTLARGAVARPTVFSGIEYGGAWYMPGGNSYIANFIRDAGGRFLWDDDEATGSRRLDFESVLDRAGQADFWINTGIYNSEEELLAADGRYANFAALRDGRAFNNSGRLNGLGGNDYWEHGIANPQEVLHDLIRILHPELLPDHSLIWYRPLRRE